MTDEFTAKPLPSHTDAPTMRGRFLTLLADLTPALAAFIIVMAIQLNFGGLTEPDGHYHIRAAAGYLDGSMQAAGGDFRWTQHSIWNGGYSDKDYLWHIALTPLVAILGPGWEGLELAAMIGAGLAAALLALVLTRVMRAQGVLMAPLWALATLTASEVFIYRITHCRAQLLSVIFALLGAHILTRAASSSRALSLVIVGALYALSYTAPHLLIALAVLWGTFDIIAGGDRGQPRNWRRSFAPVLWSTIGVALGAFLHPESLNLLKLWGIQNLLVPLQSLGAVDVASTLAGWFGATLATSPELAQVHDLGMELGPISGRNLATNHLTGVILLCAPWVLMSACRVVPDRRLLFLAACTFTFFLMTLVSERFVEYWAPFSYLTGAIAVSRALSSPVAREWRAKHHRLSNATVALLVVGICACLYARPALLYSYISGRDVRAWKDAGQAILRHVPEGTAVFHPSWDQFPELWFHCPNHLFVTALDPVFMHARDPKLYDDYMRIRRGDTVSEPGPVDGVTAHHKPDVGIRKLFGMDYVIIRPKDQSNLALELQRAEVAGRITLVDSDTADTWRLYRLTK